MQLNDVLKAYGALDEAKKVETAKLAKHVTGAMEWVPNPGPQTEAYLSQADEIFYGGAAGGGKTDLLLGVALNQAHRSRIFRRHFKDIEGTGGLAPRLAEIRRSWSGYHSQQHIWRLGRGREIEFGAFSNAKEAEDYQGRPADYYGLDEITQFEEHLVRFLMTWNRSTVNGVRTRMIATGNPPITAEGRWVIKYWAPWLDSSYPNPAKPGELRWVTAINGEDVWVDGPEPIEVNGEMVRPKSRTFIPAALSDNPDLAERGDYAATLAGLPEPYRSAFKDGNFNAALQDDDWQIIPTEWVLLANQRWEMRTRDPKFDMGAMTSMGVDVAQGGPDKTSIARLHTNFFQKMVREKGINTKAGSDVAALVIKHRSDGAVVNIDCGGGWGLGAFEHLDNNDVDVQACVGARASTKRDRTGKFGFKNKRAEWAWSFREALDPETGDAVALPPDGDLLADLTSMRRKPSENAAIIQIEDKADIIKRIGRSPDDGDSVILAWAESDPDLKRERKSRRRKRNPTTRRGGVSVGYASAKGKFHRGRQ
jgi:hypothetical protein